jgi:hypothetical protein
MFSREYQFKLSFSTRNLIKYAKNQEVRTAEKSSFGVPYVHRHEFTETLIACWRLIQGGSEKRPNEALEESFRNRHSRSENVRIRKQPKSVNEVRPFPVSGPENQLLESLAVVVWLLRLLLKFIGRKIRLLRRYAAQGWEETFEPRRVLLHPVR